MQIMTLLSFKKFFLVAETEQLLYFQFSAASFLEVKTLARHTSCKEHTNHLE
jgi:hypothetical protein